MDVVPIEALEDNYMYLLIDEASKECAAVDPVEPEKVLNQVKKLGLNLTKVLTTHHHWDHANGNPKLLELLKSKIPVYGGELFELVIKCLLSFFEHVPWTLKETTGFQLSATRSSMTT